MNMVSRGSNGFLGAAYGPDTTANGNRLAIGLVELPVDQTSCWNGTASCTYTWLPASQLG